MPATTIMDCLRQLENFTPRMETATPVNRVPRNNNFDNGHIFYAVLEYAIQFSPEREKMTYYYSISQKLLIASRQNDRHVAGYLLNKLVDNGVSRVRLGTELSYHALHSVFNPAIAYYYYFLLHDYTNAEKYMLALLENIDYLIAHGFRDGMYMKIEQYLNTSRVYFNAGEYEKSAVYAREVMQYLLSDDPCTFEFAFRDVMHSSKQLTSILDLFFNGLIFKTLAKAGPGDFYRNRFLVSVFSDLDITYNRVMDQDLRQSITAFRLILEDRGEEALTVILDSRIFESHIPSSLRYFLLNWLLLRDEAGEIPDQLRNSIVDYQRNELRLSDAQIGISQTQPAAA